MYSEFHQKNDGANVVTDCRLDPSKDNVKAFFTIATLRLSLTVISFVLFTLEVCDSS